MIDKKEIFRKRKSTSSRQRHITNISLRIVHYQPHFSNNQQQPPAKISKISLKQIIATSLSPPPFIIHKTTEGRSVGNPRVRRTRTSLQTERDKKSLVESGSAGIEWKVRRILGFVPLWKKLGRIEDGKGKKKGKSKRDEDDAR